MIDKINYPILPSKDNIIGILGGGQLGKMIALSANRMGYRTHLYCPKGDNPAEAVVNEITHGDWDDFDKLVDFSNKVVCATSEFENIPSKTLELLSKNTKITPSSLVFRCAQIRSKEKDMALKSGFKTLKWFLIKNTDDLINASKKLQNSGILKTNSFGYDGKGQIKINGKTNLFNVWESLGSVECVLEEYVSFKREISIMYFKSQDESDGFFPLSENYHEDGILKKSRGPIYLHKSTEQELKLKVKQLAKNLNFYGILALEFFELENGTLVFNELAPRPHNSFHWTIEACNNSQFDILLKTICGLPVKNVNCAETWEMNNIIGFDINNLEKINNDQDYCIHIYKI